MGSLGAAEKYFQTRLNSQVWEGAGQEEKERALATAERTIDQYRGRVDGTRFSYAVFEQAVWLLSGDQRAELQQAGVQSMGLGQMSESYLLRGRDPGIAPRAWLFIRGPSLKAGALI